MEALPGYRTSYYSNTLGITIRTYYPGDFDEERAHRGAERDAEETSPGSASVRVEFSPDGRVWREVARYEGPGEED